MEIGVIGVPNVGKSTLLELLSGGGISGRLAVAQVPDARLDMLADLFHPKKVTPATIRLTEVPGLLPGHLEGGQRNSFFDAVRRSDALLHVVRAFGDPAVPHPLGSVDPLRDARLVEEELILADLERAESLAQRLSKKHPRTREEDMQWEILGRCASALSDALPLRCVGLSEGEIAALSGFGLLTLRQELLVCNTDEDRLREGRAYPELQDWATSQAATLLVFSAKVEREIATMEPTERGAFLEAFGLEEPGTNRLARAAYRVLRLVSFFTAGADEVRAWPVTEGTSAKKAAGKIHSDIERGFIRAEVAAFHDLEAQGTWKALRETGGLRLEGKDYVVQDGDIITFRFNV